MNADSLAELAFKLDIEAAAQRDDAAGRSAFTASSTTLAEMLALDALTGRALADAQEALGGVAGGQTADSTGCTKGTVEKPSARRAARPVVHRGEAQ
jgi:hypothetical protein